ncbi:MAG: potassium/proton antiporter [Salinivirgaceae bacterium]|nr:potassium/proton antiporter [Salinivirgaceae bacterium]
MEITFDNIILIGAILLFVSLLASRTSKLGIPSLILFLFVGILAGVEGPGHIEFSNYTVAKFIGSVAMSFILFSGGLDTKWSDIKPVIISGGLLSTAGVFITCFTTALLSHWLLNLPLRQSLLLGAIVSSTDAAAVFSILRSKSIGLKGQLRPLLEFESASNDPMAYFLTIMFIELNLSPNVSVPTMLTMFVQHMLIGALVGYSMGVLIQRIFNWIKFDYDGLYSVLMITAVLAVFGLTELLGGNSFLAIYISACTLSNRSFVHKSSLIKQFDGYAWLMQIVMFITLGMLVTPSHIFQHLVEGIVVAMVLIFVARPLCIFLLAPLTTKLDTRSKLFVSWVGLRGASPIVFAIFPLTAGVANSDTLFHIVFFVSVTSVLLQGASLPIVGRWLGVTSAVNIKKKTALDIEQQWNTKSEFRVVEVLPEYSCVGKTLIDLRLPNTIVISMIKRDGKYIVSSGSFVIKANDLLYVIADKPENFEDLTHSLTTFE